MSSLQRTDNLSIIIIKILVIELELWSTSCSKIIEPLYNDMLREHSNYIVIYIEESLYQNSRYNDIADCVIVAGNSSLDLRTESRNCVVVWSVELIECVN